MIGIIRYVYWTDWGSPAKIERASMDGSGREVLHDTDLRWPNALTIDYDSRLLYWVDAYYDRIEASSTSGSFRRVVSTHSSIQHPFSLSFYDGALYWSDWSKKIILSLSAAGTVDTLVSILDKRPMGLKVIAEDRQPLTEG